MEINDLSYGRFHSNYTNYLKIEELFGWYRNINTTNVTNFNDYDANQ